MPCENCHRTLLIYDDEKLCPKCNCLTILDTISAITISERISRYLNDLFYKQLKEWNSFHLIIYCIVKREELSRKFFAKYSLFPIGELSKYSILIGRIIENGYNLNGKIIDENSEYAVNELIDTFTKLLEFENTVLHIKNCNMNVLIKRQIEVNSVTPQKAIQTCIFVSNEKHEILFKNYSLHDIYSKEEGEKKMEEWSKLDNNDPSLRRNLEILNPENYIKKHYHILNSSYVLFTKDYTTFEVFSRLKSYNKLTRDPRKFFHFVNEFVNFGDNVYTISPIEVFMIRAKKYFSVSEDQIKEILIYTKSNNTAFPLFVGFKDDYNKDMVVNSRVFCSFIYSLLHIFITRNLFDMITQERSLEFEKRLVKERFEKNG